MLDVKLSPSQIDQETQRIIGFLQEQFAPGESVVIGISGGVDSDVVTRLAVNALGPERVKLFMVLQEGMDPRHLENARALAQDVSIPLVEIDLIDFPFSLVSALARADTSERFRPDGLIDPSRAKCSVRTAVLSTYQDRGYAVIGNSNRSELETGFFLPFGDGLGHVKPIVHLYKSQVYQLAREIGSRTSVLDQPASSGFWVGAEDLEDLAFWLYNESPIGEQIDFDTDAVAAALRIRESLTTERVDLGLLGLSRGLDDQAIAGASQLPIDIVVRLRKLRTAAEHRKRRPLGVHLEPLF